MTYPLGTDGWVPSDDLVRNRTRELMCEGPCSRYYDEEDVVRLAAAGHSAETIRREMTARMVYTPHTEVRRELARSPFTDEDQVHVIYACVKCRAERIYGVEDANLST